VASELSQRPLHGATSGCAGRRKEALSGHR